jgi:hypothetical protein
MATEVKWLETHETFKDLLSVRCVYEDGADILTTAKLNYCIVDCMFRRSALTGTQ